MLALQQNNYELSKQYSASLSHVSWEALHSGPWHSVPIAWREIHSLAAIASAVQTLREVQNSSDESSFSISSDCQTCLRSLDVALLVGGPRLARLIHPLVDNIHSISKQHPVDRPPVQPDKTDPWPLAKHNPLADPGTGQGHVWLGAALQSQESEAWRTSFTKEFGDRCSWLKATEAPGLMQFEEKYMIQQQPVLLQGVADAWPAMHRHVPNVPVASAALQSRPFPDWRPWSVACHRPHLGCTRCNHVPVSANPKY